MKDQDIIQSIEAELGISIPRVEMKDLPHYGRGMVWDGNDLTGLSLPKCRFDLHKLSHCTRLKRLYLMANQISDLTPLNTLTALTSLHLQANQISDLTPLKTLIALTDLRLEANQISDLEPLNTLTTLISLYLESNRISDLTPLNTLTSLTHLDLKNNLISSLIPLFPLTALIHLEIQANRISDLTPINSLITLTLLNLSFNKISDLAPINHLTILKHLYLKRNQVSDLTPLNTLTSLTELDLSHNQISDLTPLNPLTTLPLLYLQANQISDLTPLSPLTALTVLDLSRNQISDLTPLNPLTALAYLDLRQNRITNLPKELLQLKAEIHMDDDWRGIAVNNNPLIHPPPEIIRRGQEAIAAFFEAEGAARKLNEAKLILVGEGGAGKTSLVKRLMDVPFNPKEEVTHGIRVTPWTFDHQDNTIFARVWDFGGQEILHATHQFFLSERAVYLVLLDCRKDQRPEYWLKHVANFGGNSPVIVVLNKIDQNHGFDTDRAALMERYPQIVAFYRTSCADDTGIPELRTAIQTQLNRAELCRSSWPESWYRVKQALEAEDRPYLDQPTFRQLIQTHKVRQDHADLLVDLMHDLGVAIHFRELYLNNVYVLNPLWVVRGVYALITAPEPAATHGTLSPQDLATILTRTQNETPADQPPYPPETHGFLLKLMQKFELAYEQDNGDLLIPDLLPKGRPPLPTLDPNPLRYRVNYHFLAPGTLPRFMVKRHRDIVAKWRTGVVLKHDQSNTHALVLEDAENRRLTLSLHGAAPRPYLEILRDTLAQIQIGSHAPVEEEIACRCPKCEAGAKPQYFNLEALISKLLLNMDTELCQNSMTLIRIHDLIGEIYTPQTLQALDQISHELPNLSDEKTDTWLDHLWEATDIKPKVFGISLDLKKMIRRFKESRR